MRGRQERRREAYSVAGMPSDATAAAADTGDGGKHDGTDGLQGRVPWTSDS